MGIDKMKRFGLLVAAAVVLLAGCQKDPPSNTGEPKPVTPEESFTYAIDSLSTMSLLDKVCQMVFVRGESLNSTLSAQELQNYTSHPLRYVTKTIRESHEEYPAGGVVLFAHNISVPFQLTDLCKQIHSLKDFPLICIDEEGGAVARIAKNPAFGISNFSSCYDIGNSGDKARVEIAADNIGSYLYEYGIDVDFAPVADVFTNPLNTVIGKRAFSSDPVIAADMALTFYNALKKNGIQGCYKHYPGHGDTATDSHYGYAESTKTWEEMLDCEIIPFKKGIDNGVSMIMTAHISAPKVTGDSTPATLSTTLLTEKLRGELGFNGIIITDAMEMGAISKQYGVPEACVLAIMAGADIVLMPLEYRKAIDAIVAAVNDGRIPEERIDMSVRKILKLKEKAIARYL